MAQTCTNPFSPCFDNSSPLTNLSSEAPDLALFRSHFPGSFGPAFGTPFGTADGYNPGTIPPGGGDSGPDSTAVTGDGTPGIILPPIGVNWDLWMEGDFCFSAESQNDADLCAVRLGDEADSQNWPVTNPDGTTTPQTLFFNVQQSCTMFCADGSPFTFTVLAGRFTSFTQANADANAYSYACRQADLAMVCLIDLLNSGCVGQAYSGTVVAAAIQDTSSPRNFTFEVTSGSIPSGLADSTATNGYTYILSGTPTTFGTSTFTLRATDQLGNFASRQFTIVVLEITTASLPDVAAGADYSQQLSTSGGTAPYTYDLSGGSLPPGLGLSTGGLISGTVPDDTDPAIYGFNVTSTDADGHTCTKHFTIEVIGCPPWSDGEWVSYPFGAPGGGITLPSLGTFGFDSFSGAATSGASFCRVDGTLAYRGPECDCRLAVTFSGTWDGAQGPNSVVTITSSVAGLLALRNFSGSGNGTFTTDFTVADTVGATITLTVTFSITGDGSVTDGPINTTATIVNL